MLNKELLDNLNAPPAPREPRFELVPLATIQREQPRFLVYPYLPRGEFVLFDGDPGEGKTWAWMAIAAGLTGSLVCKVPYDYTAKRDALVAVLTCEDSLAKTVRGRLEDLGADLNRVYVFRPSVEGGAEQPTAEDFAEVIPALKRLRPDLIVIDPVTLWAATEKDFDSNKATAVRKLFLGLISLVRELDAVLLGCRHYRKERGKALHRGLGSIDYAAIARSILSFGRHPKTGARLIAHPKSNLAPAGPSLEYALSPDDAAIPFAWVTTHEDVNPDDLTYQDSRDATEEAAEEQTKLEEAIDFLEEILRGGPTATKEVLRAARDAGISERTLRRAREELKKRGAPVVLRRSGFGGACTWEILRPPGRASGP